MKRRATSIIAFLLNAFLALSGCQPCCAQATQPALKFIGVWRQPVESFDKWKVRGVNTMFGAVYGPDQQVKTAAAYVAAAHAKKLTVVDADSRSETLSMDRQRNIPSLRSRVYVARVRPSRLQHW
jgi:hypothetical protein